MPRRIPPRWRASLHSSLRKHGGRSQARVSSVPGGASLRIRQSGQTFVDGWSDEGVSESVMGPGAVPCWRYKVCESISY